jgi:pimeloyl-ACP methyl ester carboxylesterase
MTILPRVKMARARANGIEIEYEVAGDAAAPPMLLVMGLAMQLIQWPDAFVARLAARGFRTIRFDNRDAGLSSKVERPYTLDDMAEDAAGLLDALAIDAAHVVGVSLGGMVAQLVAIRHPRRVLSLASIMATTGAQGVGAPRPELLPVLFTPPPAERAAYIESRAAVARQLAGSLRSDEAWVRDTIARAFDRAFYPQGTGRQLQAILSAADRTPALAALRVPTVVIHGTEDPLVDPSGGDATARAIPGARLVRIEGMGHDLPESAWATILDAIEENARRAATHRAST